MKDVGDVIADAAYDAAPLCTCIADDLGATVPIEVNPNRTKRPPLDWRLHNEGHQVERLLNRIKHFRSVASRCEKTFTTFMGFVHLACAIIWLRQMQTGLGPIDVRKMVERKEWFAVT